MTEIEFIVNLECFEISIDYTSDKILYCFPHKFMISPYEDDL